MIASIAGELKAQWAYTVRLCSYVGPLKALQTRALDLASRLLGGRRFEILMHPPSLLHPVRLRVGSSDLATYHQVLVEEFYGTLGDLDPEVIVDCGANSGLASAFLLSRYPRARVIALESFPDSAELCRRNLAPYGARAEVRAAAVWSHACRLVIEAQRREEWGVRVRPALPGEAGDVDAIGLADLDLPRIDLLKMGIEGSEEAVLSAGVEAWLARVRAMAIELHGPACERAFHAALASYEADYATAADMTIVRNLRPRRS